MNYMIYPIVLLCPVVAVACPPKAQPAKARAVARPSPMLKLFSRISSLDLEAKVVSAKRTGKKIDASRPKFGDYGPLIKATAEFVVFECKITAIHNNSLKIPLKPGDKIKVSADFDLPIREDRLPLRPGLRFRLFSPWSELKHGAEDREHVPDARVLRDEPQDYLSMFVGVHINKLLDRKRIDKLIKRLPKQERKGWENAPLLP